MSVWRGMLGPELLPLCTLRHHVIPTTLPLHWVFLSTWPCRVAKGWGCIQTTPPPFLWNFDSPRSQRFPGPKWYWPFIFLYCIVPSRKYRIVISNLTYSTRGLVPTVFMYRHTPYHMPWHIPNLKSVRRKAKFLSLPGNDLSSSFSMFSSLPSFPFSFPFPSHQAFTSLSTINLRVAFLRFLHFSFLFFSPHFHSSRSFFPFSLHPQGRCLPFSL